MLEELKINDERKTKNSFYASDVNRPSIELYWAYVGEPRTNPIKWYETLKMGAGNGVESAMLRVLKDSGIVAEDYDQNVHGVINFTRNGIEIHGRADAITKDGFPIEIKSINNKNQFDISAYEDGYPRENYVGQLAIYMDALGMDTGYLFVASVDGLHRFWFKCVRRGSEFKCGNVVFNVDKEYARWSSLYVNHIEKKVEPDIFEYRYKIPVDKIDWKKISKDKITKARNNRAVIGDYQVTYSPWKDLWIKKQGETLGYTAEELVKINEATKGFTTWKK